MLPEPERTGAKVDVDRPNSARMYDYYLGGSTNFAVDREAAEAGLTAMPYARDYAVANRAFLRRAVSHLASQGVDQFLDLGSGIPTVGNVHEIAHRHNPQARVAYVDHEPVAVAHARALLGENPTVSIDEADIRDPEAVLNAHGVAKIDFSRPVAVLAVAILPFVPDQDEATALTAAYRDACPPGSYLAVTHISQLAATDEQVVAAEEVMARTPTPVRWRPPNEIAELLDGYELLPPGLVPTPSWHPEQPPSEDDIARANAYAAVGRLV
ncbi:S-adenosyl methyltransferase [Saccharopolyspora flava]|uniref:S-adenosyl methyltransferase n=1 Tax=Saccharopolyspora flava TaxID=95161 RepID=A0A1I6V1X4_9PSEU|nr:S-adenosyl methyltransferase [Saccharopolyspora flava]